jgi:hypothetical protein
MRTSVVCLTLSIWAGATWAPDGGEPEKKKTEAASIPERVAVGIVSADPVAKTITVRPLETTSSQSESMDRATLRVEGKAVGTLKDLRSGEKVTITCRATPTGPDISSNDHPGTDAPIVVFAGGCAFVTSITREEPKK